MIHRVCKKDAVHLFGTESTQADKIVYIIDKNGSKMV